MESRDDAIGLDMPNGIDPEVKYYQKFVQAIDPNKPGPCNYSATIAPSLEEAMKGIDRN